MQESDRQANPEQMLRDASIVARYSNVEPGNFRAEIQKVWNFGSELIDHISKGVEAQTITPVQGVKVASCLAGTLLGYEEFHPRSSAETPQLVTTLLSQLSHDRSSERELVGAR